MNPFVHEYYIDLTKGTTIERDRRPLSQGDAYADKLVTHIQDNGRDVDLDGVGVSAKVIRYDGQTVPLTGTVEDGAACVSLDGACYAVPGDIRVTLTLSAGRVVQSVLVVLLNVETSETSVVVDNGVIGDIASLLAAIADMKAATQEAVDTTEEAQRTIDDIQARADLLLGEMLPAPAIVVDAAGEHLSITDGAARQAIGLVSSIEAVQSGSGDPSPDNIRPITGWGTVLLTRTGQNIFERRDGWQPMNLKAGTKLYAMQKSSVAEFKLYGVDKDGVEFTVASLANGAYTTVTLDRDCTALAQSTDSFNDMGDSGMVMVSLNPFSAIEPAVVNTLTTALPETVYGGSLDWTTGILTVDMCHIGLTGGESWSYNGTQFITSLAKAGANKVGMCSHYIYKVLGTAAAMYVDGKYLAAGKGIADRYASTDDWKAFLAAQYAAGTPVQVAYHLAEPYTIQLTAQQLDMLKGSNSLWSDCGDTSATYIADTKLYIDNAVAALAAGILNA